MKLLDISVKWPLSSVNKNLIHSKDYYRTITLLLRVIYQIVPVRTIEREIAHRDWCKSTEIKASREFQNLEKFENAIIPKSKIPGIMQDDLHTQYKKGCLLDSPFFFT